jgi:hypothetical protein
MGKQLLLVTLVGLGLTLACGPAGPSAPTPGGSVSSRGSTPAKAPVKVIRFALINAADGSFVAKLPQDWSVSSAVRESFRASSPEGDAVFDTFATVAADQQSLQNFTNQTGGNLARIGVLPIASQPLDPVAIVSDLSPRLAPQIRNLRVVTGTRLTASQNADAALGVVAALVHYTYTLLPGQVAAGARSDYAPALLAQQQVAMEGEILVYEFPLTNALLYNYWQFLVIGNEAPASRFQQDLALEVGIQQSLTYRQPPSQQMDRSPGQALRDSVNALNQTNDSWLNSWQHVTDALGGQFPFVDPRNGTSGTIPIDSMPRMGTLWFCGNQSAPIPRLDSPGTECTAGQSFD